MNVLIVEDDVSAGAPLAEGLAAEGFDVTMVDGAENPVETAGAINPCAVLFDTSSPGAQEFDACREMRRIGRTEPILFLSGRHDASDRANGLNASGATSAKMSGHISRRSITVGTECLRPYSAAAWHISSVGSPDTKISGSSSNSLSSRNRSATCR